MLFVVLFLLIGLLIFSLFFLWFLLDKLSITEDYVTDTYTTEKVGELLKTYPLHTLYDLGSSNGGFALAVATQNPHLSVIGIDNSLFRILVSKFRAYTHGKKVTFRRKDIFSADVSQADAVYVYIPKVLLPKLAEKLERELRPGALVITSGISFLHWKPSKVIPKNPHQAEEQDIYIYTSPFVRA